jgi:hypothetical protein
VAQEFVIRIRADDAATATVKKIQAALGKVTEPIDNAQKRLGKLGADGQSSLGKLEKGFRNAATSASKVVDKIVEIVPGLTAIGGAASLAGLSALAVRFGAFGFTLNRNAKLLDMNAQSLAAWHVAARRAGVSDSEFDSSMSSSQMAIRAAANGADPHAMLLLQKMGVQIAKNKDGTVDYYSTQMRLMKAIQGQRSVEAQRDTANAFGMGSLLPMIQQGTWDADKARAYKKGLVPTDAEIAQAKAFNEDITDLRSSAEGLGNAIGSSLIPVLDPVVKSISRWLDQNRAQIADKLAAAVQSFVTWLSKIDWDEVSAKAKALWDDLGGIKGVAIAIAAIKFAGPISGALNLIAALVRLTTSTVPAAVGALGTLGTAGIAAWGALQVAKLAGLPDVDNKQGVDDVRNGDWLAASTHLPAGQFLRALAARAAGKSDSDIAASLGAGANPAASGSASGVPLGIRTNNPLNMLHDGNQRTYASPEEGITAAVKNLERGYQGLTLAQIADKWTGGARTGNTPQQMANYVSLLAGSTGLDANDVPDLGDSKVVASILKGQIRAENGQQPYSDEQINAGVAAGIGARTAPSDGARNARVAGMQQAALHITFDNVPPGVRPEAKTHDGSYLPTKVNYRLDGM